jgi:hypothetical protein
MLRELGAGVEATEDAAALLTEDAAVESAALPEVAQSA